MEGGREGGRKRGKFDMRDHLSPEAQGNLVFGRIKGWGAGLCMGRGSRE